MNGLNLQIEEINAEPHQYLKKYQYFNIDVFDMSNKSVECKNELEKKIAMKPFEIIKSPLYYFAIVKESSDKGYIIVKLHHLISDAWTYGNVANQLSEHYEAFLSGKEIIEKKSSYINYIETEQEYISSEKFQKDRVFWQEYLKGFKEPVGLKYRENNNDIKGKRYSIKLEEMFNNKLKDYCKENKLSPYTVFITALGIYIHRTTGREDIIIGTPILNRSNFKEKQIMGMFVSTMPVRFKIDETETFLNMCKKSSLESMKLFRHQKYPYSLILEDFRKNNNLKDNLYKTMVSYQNARANYAEDKKYKSRWIYSEDIQDEFAIHIMDMDETGILEVHFDYLVALFEEKEIEYIASRILEIIKDGITNNKIIENIEIMTLEEKNKIIYEFNNTFKIYNKKETLIKIFEKQANSSKEKVALVFENKEMTYKELNERSNKIGNYLLSNNIKSNDVIAVMCNRGFEMMISILGILKAGAAYLPIDPSLPQERINYMLKDSNVKVILNQNQINKIIDTTIEKNNLNIVSKSEDNFLILYTSGTTGNPKGAKIKNKSLMNFFKHFKSNEVFKNIDAILSITTISFDIFIFEAIIPLLLGKKVVIANEDEQRISKLIVNLIKQYNIDMMQSTPSRMKFIISLLKDISELKDLKKVVLAGEKLPYDLKKDISSMGIQVYNGYGPTETTIFSSFINVTDEKKITIGKPLSNTQFYIKDLKERLLPIGIPGELYISGDGVCNGYINNEKLTNKMFKISSGKLEYRTGDICKFSFDGNVFCYGRNDGQIKIHGLRIELEEIEIKARSYKNIQNAAAILNNDEKINLYYTLIDKDIEITSIELGKHLSKSLPKYMVPSRIIRLEEFPLTLTGKISKKELEKIKTKDNNREEKIVFPETETETVILNIIESYIEDNNISIDKDLIYIGMDSFHIIRLVTEINNRFQIDLSVKKILGDITIRGLAKLVDESKRVPRVTKSSYTEKICRLSPNQKQIFASYIMNSNSTVYNMPGELVMDKTVNVEKIIRAIEELVNNNIILKCNIVMKDSEAMLKYNKKDFKIKIFKKTEEEYFEAKENFIKPFNILEDELIRIAIFITEKHIYLLFDGHHIIFDGVSINIFLKKLEEYYNNNKEPEKTNDFFDYLNDVINIKDSFKYKNAEEYFIKRLSNGFSSTSLETDYTRNKIRSFNGRKYIRKIKSELGSKILDFCKNNGCTPNTLFLSAIKIVLSKYTYSDEITIGIATSGRNEYEYRDVIGMFVKTMPHLDKINWDIQIKEYLKNTKKDIINIIENDCYPIEELIPKMDIKSETVINIMYAYQNLGYPKLNFGNTAVRINEIDTHTSKFDLTLQVIPTNNSFDISAEYCTDLYKEETIKALVKHIENVINSMIESKYNLLKDIEMLDKKEKSMLITKMNEEESTLEFDNILETFRENVKKYPYQKAVIYKDRVLTYLQLDKKSNQLANVLLQKGITKKDTIAIMLDKTEELIVSIIAVLKVGGNYIPIDYELPKNRIKYMLKDSNAKIILSKEKIINNTNINKDFNIEYISVNRNSEVFATSSDAEINIKVTKNDLAYIMYTSGTTGFPKGTMNSHGGVVRLVKNTNYINILPEDKVLLSGTIAFDASVFELWSAILNGASLHVINKETLLNPESFEDYINNNNINVMLLTTSVFNKFAMYKPEVFKNIKYLITGGEVFPVEAGKRVLDKCKNTCLINAYGPTENAVISTTYTLKNHKDISKEVPIGKPISNSICYVYDKCNKILPMNAIGELVVGGYGLGKGYVNNEKLIKKLFLNDENSKYMVYKTGDLVKLNHDMNLLYRGRIDNQIKIRGYRIELEEIKNNIIKIEGIKDAYVIFDNEKKRINSFILKDDTFKYKEEDIKNKLKKDLPNYMVPEVIVFLEEIPLNINGKVDIGALKNIKITKKKEKSKAETELEKSLFSIWKSLLKKEEFGIDDDFFDIGGDSILATEFVMKSSQKQYSYTYADLYNYRTIRKLSNKLPNQLDEMYNISNYNYDKINNAIKNKNKKNNNKEDVLLTGATGFLGAHILSNMVDTSKSRKIYCIVRAKNGITGETRLKERMKFFFKNKYEGFFGTRIIVIEGDILEETIFSKVENINNIGSVINSAAVVKHFAERDLFLKMNVKVAINLAKLCIKNKMHLYHVSTLSVCGNMLETGQIEQKFEEKVNYSENELFIEQKLYNGYVYSKYIAEVELLKLCEEGLNLTIMRMGNLTGRYTDGKFQPNIEENAFVNRIKAFVELEMIPNKFKDVYIEMSPIDQAADIIVRALYDNCDYRILHIFNDNHIYMRELLQIIKELNIKIEEVTELEFKNKLHKLIEQKNKNITGIIIDLDRNQEIKYTSNIIVKSDITKRYLNNLKFRWEKLDENYIKKYFSYLIKANFIISPNKEE
ncbi:MAG: amino acid adenylation domain-containing protein [Clostridia bacterium]|nr:amino acid adenylation domain-containing protein [Clostridia bacterium]MDD4375707.1 amino acid adenylation domain-containing protein [Clostridia bacterium]